MVCSPPLRKMPGEIFPAFTSAPACWFSRQRRILLRPARAEAATVRQMLACICARKRDTRGHRAPRPMRLSRHSIRLVQNPRESLWPRLNRFQPFQSIPRFTPPVITPCISVVNKSWCPFSVRPALFFCRILLNHEEDNSLVRESGILPSAFHFVSVKLVCCLSCCPLRCGSQERNCVPDGATTSRWYIGVARDACSQDFVRVPDPMPAASLWRCGPGA